MNKKRILLICLGTIIILIIIGIVLNIKTSLTFELIDSTSESWVFDSSIRLQDKIVRGFKTKEFTFNNIKSGKHTIYISAPNYETKELTININPGSNNLKEPIKLTGYKIPDLINISVFEEKKEDNLFFDIRFIDSQGNAVLNHPCLDIKIICRISEQIGTEDSLSRGETLYSGIINWVWETEPKAIYRYSALLSIDEIKMHRAPVWIIDYLILIPDPRKIDDTEINNIISDINKIENLDKLTDYLMKYSDKLQYFITASTNIKSALTGG